MRTGLAALGLALGALLLAGGTPADENAAAEPDSTAREAGIGAAAPTDSSGANSTLNEAGADSEPNEAAADTTRRATGTPFRFGGTVAMAQRHGTFPLANVPGRKGEVARSGPGRWFGLDGTYTLFFRADRLQRVGFQSGVLSPRARDYAQDQLRSAGFQRRCERANGPAQVCTWLGRSRVVLDLSLSTLMATIYPPPPPRRVATPVAVVPDTFVLGRPGAPSKLPPPEVASSPAPEYPASAGEGRVQGNVWVRAQVDTAGAVVRATVIRGIPELDAAAIQNALRWRFQPYRLNGVPARFEVEFPVRFVLH